MKRWCGLILPLIIGATLLCGYVAPEDRKYVDYFLKLHAADLFRSKSFLLDSSWGYVSRKGVERVDMRFSFYRVLTVNQARELIVAVAQELIEKINSDSEMRKKNILSAPFSVCQLHLEIRTDNALSRNSDVASIQRIILDRGTITYQSYPASQLLYGRSSVYKESYEQALMFLDLPTEFETSEKKTEEPSEKYIPFSRRVESPEVAAFVVPQEDTARHSEDSSNMLGESIPSDIDHEPVEMDSETFPETEEPQNIEKVPFPEPKGPIKEDFISELCNVISETFPETEEEKGGCGSVDSSEEKEEGPPEIVSDAALPVADEKKRTVHFESENPIQGVSEPTYAKMVWEDEHLPMALHDEEESPSSFCAWHTSSIESEKAPEEAKEEVSFGLVLEPSSKEDMVAEAPLSETEGDYNWQEQIGEWFEQKRGASPLAEEIQESSLSSTDQEQDQPIEKPWYFKLKELFWEEVPSVEKQIDGLVQEESKASEHERVAQQEAEVESQVVALPSSAEEETQELWDQRMSSLEQQAEEQDAPSPLSEEVVSVEEHRAVDEPKSSAYQRLSRWFRGHLGQNSIVKPDVVSETVEGAEESLVAKETATPEITEEEPSENLVITESVTENEKGVAVVEKLDSATESADGSIYKRFSRWFRGHSVQKPIESIVADGEPATDADVVEAVVIAEEVKEAEAVAAVEGSLEVEDPVVVAEELVAEEAEVVAAVEESQESFVAVEEGASDLLEKHSLQSLLYQKASRLAQGEVSQKVEEPVAAEELIEAVAAVEEVQEAGEPVAVTEEPSIEGVHQESIAVVEEPILGTAVGEGVAITEPEVGDAAELLGRSDPRGALYQKLFEWLEDSPQGAEESIVAVDSNTLEAPSEEESVAVVCDSLSDQVEAEEPAAVAVESHEAESRGAFYQKLFEWFQGSSQEREGAIAAVEETAVSEESTVALQESEDEVVAPEGQSSEVVTLNEESTTIASDNSSVSEGIVSVLEEPILDVVSEEVVTAVERDTKDPVALSQGALYQKLFQWFEGSSQGDEEALTIVDEKALSEESPIASDRSLKEESQESMAVREGELSEATVEEKVVIASDGFGIEDHSEEPIVALEEPRPSEPVALSQGSLYQKLFEWFTDASQEEGAVVASEESPSVSVDALEGQEVVALKEESAIIASDESDQENPFIAEESEAVLATTETAIAMEEESPVSDEAVVALDHSAEAVEEEIVAAETPESSASQAQLYQKVAQLFRQESEEATESVVVNDVADSAAIKGSSQEDWKKRIRQMVGKETSLEELQEPVRTEIAVVDESEESWKQKVARLVPTKIKDVGVEEVAHTVAVPEQEEVLAYVAPYEEVQQEEDTLDTAVAHIEEHQEVHSFEQPSVVTEQKKRKVPAWYQTAVRWLHEENSSQTEEEVIAVEETSEKEAPTALIESEESTSHEPWYQKMARLVLPSKEQEESTGQEVVLHDVSSSEEDVDFFSYESQNSLDEQTVALQDAKEPYEYTESGTAFEIFQEDF